MRFVSRLFSIALLLTLLCTPAIAADLTGSSTATGVVRAADTVDLVAPYSGMLLPFDLSAGDTVSAGDVLFELDTLKIYAPFDGKLGALFAAVGDDAQSVAQRYGSIAAMEPANPYILNAGTQGAYDDPENKHIHIGETLYFKATHAARVKGVGRVIAVNGNSYRVEVTSGDLEIGESVTLYRDELYDHKSNVGRGVCSAAEPIYVQGTGRVLKMHVQEGDKVAAGDLLLETASADAAPTLSSPVISAPMDATISALHVVSGQNVAKGQVLMTLADTRKLEVICDVDEIDLGALHLGDTLPIIFDFAPGAVYQGTITEISMLGAVRQNAAYYPVTLSVGEVPGLRLGMSATVYLDQ